MASFTVCVSRARRLRIRSISASSPPRAARAPVQASRGFRARRAPAPVPPERTCGPRSHRAPHGPGQWCNQIEGKHHARSRNLAVEVSHRAGGCRFRTRGIAPLKTTRTPPYMDRRSRLRAPSSSGERRQQLSQLQVAALRHELVDAIAPSTNARPADDCEHARPRTSYRIIEPLRGMATARCEIGSTEHFHHLRQGLPLPTCAVARWSSLLPRSAMVNEPARMDNRTSATARRKAQPRKHLKCETEQHGGQATRAGQRGQYDSKV